MMEVRRLPREDWAGWDRAMRGSPNASVFLGPDWLEGILPFAPGCLEVLGVYESRTLVAGACCYLHREKIGTGVRPPAFTPVHAPWLRAAARKDRASVEQERLEALTALCAAVSRLGAFAEFFLPVGFPDLRPFQWAGWETRARYTYRLERSAPGVLEAGFSHDIRKQVAKARREGLRAEPLEDLDVLAGLWMETAKRNRVAAPYSRADFMAMLERQRGPGRLQAWVARLPDGTPVAARAAVLDGEIAHDWVAGSVREHFDSGATPFLLSEMMASLPGEVRRFDFGGADYPSIARFKSKFGGELLASFSVSRTRGMRARLGTVLARMAGP